MSQENITTTPPLGEQSDPSLISRERLRRRWEVSKETIKRMERAGKLTGMRFNSRLLRYRLEDILRIEAEAEGRKFKAQTVPRPHAAEVVSVN